MNNPDNLNAKKWHYFEIKLPNGVAVEARFPEPQYKAPYNLKYDPDLMLEALEDLKYGNTYFRGDWMVEDKQALTEEEQQERERLTLANDKFYILSRLNGYTVTLVLPQDSFNSNDPVEETKSDFSYYIAGAVRNNQAEMCKLNPTF